MNNEIKEILDNLDFSVNHTKCWVEPLGLNQDTWKILLDYITNLQQENERLKEELEEHDETLENTFNLVAQLTLRIDKANKCIEKQKKKMYKSRNKIALFILMKLENILQNGSEEK